MIKCAHEQSCHPFGRITKKSVLACSLAAGLVMSSGSFAQSTESQTGDKATAFEDLPITVKSGDTFSGIIARELKSLDAWGEVARYNKLESPDQLVPGDVIVIPAELLRLKNYATVVFAKGKALHHEASGAKVELKKGARIYSGDLIETKEDGFVSLSFNGGSSVNIQPDSTMKINVLECVDTEEACKVLLESGKGQLGLDVQSVGFAKPTVFNISTPYASAAVRGTRFDFDINDGNALGVTEGTVEISLNGVSTDVGVGKGVLAGEGRSINELFDLLPEPDLKLRDDITYVSDEDIINWEPLNAAANYLIAYAPSESMNAVITSRTETGFITKPQLPLGEAFVSARAVAANGLRGFTGVSKIAIVNIDESVEPPALEISVDEDNVMQITATGDKNSEVEVKLGKSLAIIDDREYIVAEQLLTINGGDTQTIQIDSTSNWYLQGRIVVDQSTVSPYGLLYLYEKPEG